jgi:hypothetical protein
MFRRGPRISLVAAIYIAIGIFVAWDHNYFDNVDRPRARANRASARQLRRRRYQRERPAHRKKRVTTASY